MREKAELKIAADMGNMQFGLSRTAFRSFAAEPD